MNIADQILYEDNHLIAVNKQPGQLVQGDKTGDTCIADDIKLYLKQRYNKPGNVFCGVVHRLDRPVSGVVVFAKTSKALSRMNEMVKNRQLQKTYWAVVRNRPPHEAECLSHWLWRDEKANKSYVVESDTNSRRKQEAKLAELDYRLIATSEGGYNLLEVSLHTGRHHQIRCQLAHIGCPIKGDLKYGAPRSNPDGSISLHARRVAFEHPVSHLPIVITAPNATFEAMFGAIN
ncbi:MAG: RluA family pseudouridine synthase [Bacteroidales bacterium]|nr:RluA family pseudouridine synthase [Bacteroidales bacterium]